MAAKNYNIEDVKELWKQEPNDNIVFKAATEDIEEYPPKVQTIIEEEAIRRGLLKNRGEMPISSEKLHQDNKIKHNEKNPSLMQKLPELIGSGLSFVLFFILYKYMGLSLAIRKLPAKCILRGSLKS